MICLSAYTVLEYFVWLKKNYKQQCDTFLTELNKNWNNIRVDLTDVYSRNLVFKVHIGNKVYFVKQFRPDIADRKKYFENESSILQSNIKIFGPELLLVDKLNQVIITSALNNNDLLFSKLKIDSSDNIPDYLVIIKKIGKNMKEIHRSALVKSTFSSEQTLGLIMSNAFSKANTEFYLYIHQLKNSWNQPALIHFDIRKPNLFFTDNSLKMIDWEFSRIGDIHYDIASFLILAFWNYNNYSLFLVKLSVNSKKFFQSVILSFKEGYGQDLNLEKLKLYMLVQNFDCYQNNNYFKTINDIFDDL